MKINFKVISLTDTHFDLMYMSKNKMIIAMQFAQNQTKK